MATFNIELNSKPIKGSNEKNLLLRITVKRKHIRLKLMYSVLPSQFNTNGRGSKYIRAAHPEHARINNYISKMILLAKDVVTKLETEGKSVSLQAIRAKVLQPKSTDFFLFAQRFLDEQKKQGNAGNYKKYRTVINSLKEFHASNQLFFDELNQDFLFRYESFLRKKDSAQTTIHSYLGRIRSLFNKAIRAGVIDRSIDPFSNYKLQQGSVEKERLSEDEITKIEKLNLPKDNLLWHVRNAFLFSFYNAGIRISDILLLTWDNVQNGRLNYKMYKTDRFHSLKLKEKPLHILEQYKGTNSTHIFPFLSERYDYSDPMFLHDKIVSRTALINRYLKRIGLLAGINKKITTHTARHSFADIARQKTDNIYNLSKTLGHSSIKVTEAYLASFDENAVDDTLDSMFSN